MSNINNSSSSSQWEPHHQQYQFTGNSSKNNPAASHLSSHKKRTTTMPKPNLHNDASFTRNQIHQLDSHSFHFPAGITTPPEFHSETDIDTDDTLTMGCEDPCDDCSGGCTTSASTTAGNGTNKKNMKNGLTDIEDFEAELAKLQARTKEVQELMAKARIDGSATTKAKPEEPKLRSADWFNRQSDMGMSSLYVERYLNLGFTMEELMSDKPIIGIAQSGSDIAPVRFPLHLPYPHHFFFCMTLNTFP